MLTSDALALLLLGLPFISLAVIVSVPGLRNLASAWNKVTVPIGFLGLVCLMAGLLGFLSPGYALPVMVGAGALSGFAMVSLSRADRGGDGGDWRGGDDPPDDPPPNPVDGEAADWELFDVLRARWERGRIEDADTVS